MNRDIVEGNWRQFKGLVRELWGRLTDDELEAAAGKRDRIAGKILEEYGVAKGQVDKQIRGFDDRCRDNRSENAASLASPYRRKHSDRHDLRKR